MRIWLCVFSLAFVSDNYIDSPMIFGGFLFRLLSNELKLIEVLW